MNTMVIDFDEAGVAQAMHNDALPLGFLGEMEITRASDIEFRQETQLWDIWLLEKGTVPKLATSARGFASYDEARKAEVYWLSQSRLGGVHPTSPEGIDHLTTYRAAWGI